VPCQIGFLIRQGESLKLGTLKSDIRKSVKTGRNQWFLLFFVAFALTACSVASRQLFFDIPPPEEESAEPVAETDSTGDQTETSDPLAFSVSGDHSERPAIEGELDWQIAQEMLPAHELGGVDWVAAIEQGLVKPRTGQDPAAADASAFKMDFFIKGPAPSFDAWFPHSAHTQWMGCQNCHGAVYRYKDNEFKMADVYAGKSCGTCHGKVAFPVTQCKRCHTEM